jgi:hypothetical protein
MSLFQNGFQQSSLYTSLDPFPTVLSFLQCTRCMPLTWRKYALTVCRTQSDPFSNTRLLQAFAPIREENFHIVNPITSIPFGPLQLQESMALIARSHILSSAISYFVRAGVNLDGFGQVQIGVMPAFPSYGDAFSMGDDYHVTRDSSPCQRFITFAKQWGRFLIAGYLNPSDIDIVEATMILAPVNAVSEKFSIPKDGLPIGSRIELGRESIVTPVTIPSCRHEVLYENWIDLHARFYKGSSVLIPVIVDFSIPAGVCYGVGHVIEACTLHRIQKIMEDLGYFRIELIKREVVLSDETLEDLRGLICGKGNRTVHKITCIREPPVWYNEVIYDEGPE